MNHHGIDKVYLDIDSENTKARLLRKVFEMELLIIFSMTCLVTSQKFYAINVNNKTFTITTNMTGPLADSDFEIQPNLTYWGYKMKGDTVILQLVGNFEHIDSCKRAVVKKMKKRTYKIIFLEYRRKSSGPNCVFTYGKLTAIEKTGLQYFLVLLEIGKLTDESEQVIDDEDNTFLPILIVASSLLVVVVLVVSIVCLKRRRRRNKPEREIGKTDLDYYTTHEDYVKDSYANPDEGYHTSM